MRHREEAQDLIDRIGIEGRLLTPDGIASMATAHAVLALLDYIQQDDNEPSEPCTHCECPELHDPATYQHGKIDSPEPEPAAYRKDRENLTRIIEARDAKILHLQEDLEGARVALRARDDALTTEMKAAQDANAAEITITDNIVEHGLSSGILISDKPEGIVLSGNRLEEKENDGPPR